MYTVIKNQVAEVPLSKADFVTRSRYPGSDAPRFDKVTARFLSPQAERQQNKVNAVGNSRTAVSSTKKLDPSFMDGHKRVDYGPLKSDMLHGKQLIDTKAYKQAFLKGQDVITYCDLKEPVMTSY